jgi:hypothetical protein
MAPKQYVVNSSPLIVFQRIGQLALLPELLDLVQIPPAVRREVFATVPLPGWVQEHKLTQPLAPRILAARLGPGEREAIALALEVRPAWLVIDDLAGRRIAQQLGIQVVGSLGLLLKAKDDGLIPAVRPLMEAMQRADFRISDTVFAGILAAAEEREER